MKAFSDLYGFFVVLILFSGCSHSSQYIPTQESTRVLRVVDGDTVDTDIGRVRLIGIDAPEKGKCGFAEAGERLRALIEDQSVVLVGDSIQSNKDNYDRLLRYVEKGDEDVGEILLRVGWAKVFPWKGGDRIDLYKKVERIAKERGVGLWERCNNHP